jgi:hypothetical protein
VTDPDSPVVDADTLLVAIDDTDTVDSEYGTGKVSRLLGTDLDGAFPACDYRGSVRQQLLVDPRIPYTTHNSAACLLCGWPTDRAPGALVERAAAFLADVAADGSDPGLCVARAGEVPERIRAFGAEAERAVLVESRAHELASDAGVFLEEYGGTGEGVIGALAAVGRTATGDRGRFIDYGRIRAYEGDVAVARLRADGLRVVTPDGATVGSGTVETEGWVRPLLRERVPTLEVDRAGDGRYRATNLGG